ncbi:hypothetical protein ElyMa_005917100 [Elysia marginata]|uniref:Uncharacterized protein n=1 Tax=Elysia marginata TaxID=1093978 RepID=A0AAV4G6G3_9GAST|nr:hypothetical protein ElyMa_005917100 [Elysia marginata]
MFISQHAATDGKAVVTLSIKELLKRSFLALSSPSLQLGTNFVCLISHWLATQSCDHAWTSQRELTGNGDHLENRLHCWRRRQEKQLRTRQHVAHTDHKNKVNDNKKTRMIIKQIIYCSSAFSGFLFF